MKRKRVRYFLIVCLVILLGLASRRISGIPLFTGDALWAMMIFFTVRFIYINVDLRTLIISSLLICYLVEISQLYQAEWINEIRRTLPGRLILGQGFLWSDMIAYTAGIMVAACVEFGMGKASGEGTEVKG